MDMMEKARTDAGDAAREEFRTYQDPIAGWLGECCWAAAGAWTDRRHAHASYTWWRKESGGKNPLGKQKFYALMRERFPVAVRNGWEGYDGLALRPQ